MKVELKLNIDTIFAINKVLQNVYDGTTPELMVQKVYRSIAFDLADKFDKLQKNNQKKATLFDAKKKHKIAIKYHEAWALWHIITHFIPSVNNDLSKVQLQLTADTIHQKL